MMLKLEGSVKSVTKEVSENSLNCVLFLVVVRNNDAQPQVNLRAERLNIFHCALHNIAMIKSRTLSCSVCGSEFVLEIKCKIICRACGYQEDCGDGVLG